jgi:pyruvate,water dikinase
VFSRELFRRWTYQVFAPGALLREKYNAFRELLRLDDACLEGIAAIEDIHDGVRVVDWARVVHLTGRLRTSVGEMAARLSRLAPSRYLDLPEYARKVDFYVQMAMDLPLGELAPPFVLPLAAVAGQGGLAGGKAANLALAARAGLRVPEGFVVTTNAFRYFLEAAALRPKIDRLLRRVDLSRPDELAELADGLRRLLLEAAVPDEVAGPLAEAAEALGLGPDDARRRLAARSSAVAEDGRASFAGQYESLLDVAPEAAVDAYRRVVAGKYAAKAVTYRVLTGFADAETPMAVLYLPMVEALASGVLHTRDGRDPEAPMAAHVVPGLGAALMAGTATAERLALSRTPPHRILAAPGSAGPGPLPQPAARELAAMGLALEEALGGPQEVEWVLPPQGSPVIVQSRPLAEEIPADQPARPTPVPAGVEPVISGGQRASGGAAAGRIRFAATVLDVETILPGTVLVTPTLPTALSRVVDRLAAVVAVSGSRAGHFASVAREFGLPVVTGLPQAFGLLDEGQEVTVDADAGAVYPGRVAALLDRPVPSRPGQGSPVATRLARLRPLVARLTLTDPASPEFVPARIQSLHDIVRFVHEQAVAEMFSLVGDTGRGLASAKKMRGDLPFSLYVLDLGGGLFPDAAKEAEVRPDQIKSTPLWALLTGLSAEDAPWPPGPPVTDDEALDRVSAGLFATSGRHLASHAVIADTYAHVMLRFGYHFTVVDTLCGADENQNYIRLRFMGGGATADRRGARLECLRRVLTHFGFGVRVTGDLLDANLARQPETRTQKRLAMLGCLLAATRMLDLRLEPGAVDDWVAGFLARTDRRRRS